MEKGEEIGWINDFYGSKDSKVVKVFYIGCIIGYSNVVVVN